MNVPRYEPSRESSLIRSLLREGSSREKRRSHLSLSRPLAHLLYRVSRCVSDLIPYPSILYIHIHIHPLNKCRRTSANSDFNWRLVYDVSAYVYIRISLHMLKECSLLREPRREKIEKGEGSYRTESKTSYVNRPLYTPTHTRTSVHIIWIFIKLYLNKVIFIFNN